MNVSGIVIAGPWAGRWHEDVRDYFQVMEAEPVQLIPYGKRPPSRVETEVRVHNYVWNPLFKAWVHDTLHLPEEIIRELSDHYRPLTDPAA